MRCVHLAGLCVKELKHALLSPKEGSLGAQLTLKLLTPELPTLRLVIRVWFKVGVLRGWGWVIITSPSRRAVSRAATRSASTRSNLPRRVRARIRSSMARLEKAVRPAPYS